MIAYTDGSYNKELKIYGCGLVMMNDDETDIRKYMSSGTPKPGENGWNVIGEIMAARLAMSIALAERFDSLTIFHDYEGVGKWPDGRWETNRSYTKDYVSFVRNVRKTVQITFEHVTGHSGNHFNNIADKLARKGAQLPPKGKRKKKNKEKKLKTTESIIIPNIDSKFSERLEISNEINPVGYEAISNFIQKTVHTEEEYKALKTGGMDRFSYMYKDELESKISKEICNFILEHINCKEQRFYEYALRWYLRGLSPFEAYTKVNYDIAI